MRKSRAAINNNDTSKSTRRVLILNNYSIKHVLIEVKAGKKPAHHLFGIDYLSKNGYDIIVEDPIRQSFIYRLGKFISRLPLLNIGDLSQQIRALKRISEYDIIYAPCQTTTTLLAVLRYFNLFNKPIVCIFHHPIIRGRLSGVRNKILFFSLRGYDKIFSLGEVVNTQVNKVAKKRVSNFIRWGGDTNYYNPKANSVEYRYDLISIGRTGRDYLTLIKAFDKTDVKLGIYCESRIIKELGSFTDNIEIVGLDNTEVLDYVDIMQLYMQSRIIAIPMFRQDSLCGLTSLNDAIGMSIPVIITKNKYLPIDVEKEGVGLSINPGDSVSWREQCKELLRDDNMLREMSKKNVELKKYYNYSEFCYLIERAIKQC